MSSVSTKILIVAEHSGGKLNPATAKCVACASKIDGAQIDIAVFAADGSAVAAEAAKIQGVKTVLKVDNAANAEPLAAVLAPQVAAVAANYTHVFGPSTSWRPRVRTDSVVPCTPATRSFPSKRRRTRRSSRLCAQLRSKPLRKEAVLPSRRRMFLSSCPLTLDS